jgi:hypothetical protein
MQVKLAEALSQALLLIRNSNIVCDAVELLLTYACHQRHDIVRSMQCFALNCTSVLKELRSYLP